MRCPKCDMIMIQLSIFKHECGFCGYKIDLRDEEKSDKK